MPTRPRMSVPRSLQDRWRERPRCRAQHLTPGCPAGVVHAIAGHGPCRCPHAQFVRELRAEGMHMHAARGVPSSSAGIGSRAGGTSLQNTTTFGALIESRHHRANDAGAVLGLVNALRFASTRPVAGPSGIDEACARHG